MLPEWVRWLLAALACYRMAQMVAFDDWFEWLRTAAGCYVYDGQGEIASRLGAFIHCVYCDALAFAPLCVALALWPTRAGDIVLAVLGIAGAQAWLQDERRAAMRQPGRTGN